MKKILYLFVVISLLTILLLAATGVVNADEATMDYEELTGKKVGVLTGSIFDSIVLGVNPHAQIEYFNSNTDLPLALREKKIDYYMVDEPTARIQLKQNANFAVVAMVAPESYAYIFNKDSSKGKELQVQMNAFLKKLKDEGVLEEIDALWFGTDEEAQTLDYSVLTGENGTLTMGVSTGIGIPFCYIMGSQIVGYDLDIALRFCKEYGYGLEVEDTNFTSILPGITSGKYDFAASCISITDERKQAVRFSDPNYMGGDVLVTIVDKDGGSMGIGAFVQIVKDKFASTFVREGRWKLFLSGIGVTLLITLMAVVFGMALGFAVYLLYRKNYRIPNRVLSILMDILQKTPVVVILMIFYYVVFVQSTLGGVWVSIIGFSLVFACSVLSLLDISVNAIGQGQTEAARALGFTDTGGFITMILPQAMQHFIPGMKGELVTLIKGTAIVGYIAVQDLTKVSDIVRGRTYEAFFPLLASAVIYFALAWLLTWIVQRIQFRANPRNRSKERILKGVKTK